jgi:hypothetical protein
MKTISVIIVCVIGLSCRQSQAVDWFRGYFIDQAQDPSTTLKSEPDIKIGQIEFFGYQSSGIKVQALRDLLPIHEGQMLSMADFRLVRAKINETVQAREHLHTTDIAAVCCDKNRQLLVYIGLNARDAKPVSYNSAPVGEMRLPDIAMKLEQQFSDGWAKAVTSGDAGEDRSQGYSLMSNSDARKLQLAIRDWTLTHESLVFQVLGLSSDAEQRQIAAEFLGYARKSQSQLNALAHAANDPDAGVRNNAVRALVVLADSDPAIAAKIPARNFISMLNSGSWTDRNKAGALLQTLTEKHEPNLLARLRAQALDSLIEMARWRDPGHAIAYRILLGRIAGMDETQIHEIAKQGDQVEKIISAAQKKAE